MSARKSVAIPPLRLGVNVDHVATLRQARGTPYPDPIEAALISVRNGADSITIHLREDRRHIQDRDVVRMLAECPVPVNLEMAVTDKMIAIARKLKPRYVCLVPERREEITTEGGLDVAGNLPGIAKACRKLAQVGIDVALFIDAQPQQLRAALKVGAPHIEIHTGRYADRRGLGQGIELRRIARFARAACKEGIEVHAGHGLTLDNVGAIARIPEIVELNIGHSIISRAVFVGMPAAVKEMRLAMTAARKK